MLFQTFSKNKLFQSFTSRKFHSTIYRKMKYDIQILSSYSDDTRPSILVMFENKHYLFNCGEGTQRLCTELGLSIAKIRNIFLNSEKWEYCGGMPGFLITMYDVMEASKNSNEYVSIHGPSRISNMNKFMEFFAGQVKYFKLLPSYENSSNLCFKDDNIKVLQYFTLDRPFNSTSIPKDDKFSETHHEDNEMSHVYKKRKMRDSQELCIQYVCYGPEIRGKFYPEKAKALGLKRGPLYGKLSNGLSVTLPDGTVITPEQVMGESRPSTIWMILKYPTLDHLQQIMNSDKLKEHWTASDKFPSYVFHMLGKGLSDHEEFKDFISKFPETSKHFIFDEDKTNPITSSSHKKVYSAFQSIYPNSFPSFWKNTFIEDYETNGQKDKNVEYSQPATIIHVEPQKNIAYSNLESSEDVEPQYPQKELGFLQIENLNELTVVPLGTASACPSKYRNVSSTMIISPDGYNYLLDCGEGTLGQITRLFGRERTEKLLYKLNIIFISHIHGDHQFGLTNIISKWLKVNHNNTKKLLLISHHSIWTVLNYYIPEKLELTRLHFVDICKLDLKNHAIMESLTDESFLRELNIRNIVPVPVVHCVDSYAVVFDHEEYGKVVFSGDCRPSQQLAEVGKNCSVLIHEATFDNHMKKEAISRRHCTIEEALKVANSMEAKNLLLTHFSQRYPKHLSTSNLILSHRMNVVSAIDQMVIRLSDFKELHDRRNEFVIE